ncbi:hypothetical protein QOT17_009341 [Balamuthia mandrillaris]
MREQMPSQGVDNNISVPCSTKEPRSALNSSRYAGLQPAHCSKRQPHPAMTPLYEEEGSEQRQQPSAPSSSSSSSFDKAPLRGPSRRRSHRCTPVVVHVPCCLSSTYPPAHLPSSTRLRVTDIAGKAFVDGSSSSASPSSREEHAQHRARRTESVAVLRERRLTWTPLTDVICSAPASSASFCSSSSPASYGSEAGRGRRELRRKRSTQELELERARRSRTVSSSLPQALPLEADA